MKIFKSFTERFFYAFKTTGDLFQSLINWKITEAIKFILVGLLILMAVLGGMFCFGMLLAILVKYPVIIIVLFLIAVCYFIGSIFYN